MRSDAGFGTVATGVSAALLSGAILGGALIYNAGAVRIRVHEKKRGGENIRLFIPAAAVPVALRFVSDEELREEAEKMREFLPALEIAAQEMARQPDFTLLEVRNPAEHVRISKRADSLMIDVESDRETVHVSFPLKLAVALARRLEAAAPPATPPDATRSRSARPDPGQNFALKHAHLHRGTRNPASGCNTSPEFQV